MGFKTPDFPPVDPETFLDKPLMERTKTLALHWCEYGFGTPKMVHTIYILKLLFFYIGVGVCLAVLTSDVGAPWEIDGWWDEPIVFQKLVLWTMLLETLGVAGSWGPLSGTFKPMTAGVLFWARVGTLRVRPWKAVPGTNGDSRTIVDVGLYLAFLATMLLAIVVPGKDSGSLNAVLPDNEAGLIRPALLIAPMVLIVLIGLRDTIVFLAARSEQYLPWIFFFTVLDFTDMIVAVKISICLIWIGAGVSKFGHHFSSVVAPMMSNSPALPSKKIKRWMYRDFPNDIRPGKLAQFLAHGGGSFVEITAPLVLLFSTNRELTIAAVVLMVVFHVFIITAFPLAVPLEWNVMFAFATVFLFAGFPAQDGFGVGDISGGWLVAVLVMGLFFPILGNLRPDLVSFLPSMRQYAGNWASAQWAFSSLAAEAKLNKLTPRPHVNQIDQLTTGMGYPQAIAETTLQQTIGWRTMHSQARGLYSLLMHHVPNLDKATVREAEFACNSIVGFNFGDGHFHDDDLLAAIQKRCGFEPGEFIVVWVESQPIHKPTQTYKVIDVATGVLERGTWNVAEAVNEQPWLPNGPINLNVTWTREGYVRPGNYVVPDSLRVQAAKAAANEVGQPA
ncbi:DUF3556 domain-containing protein [Sporichthya sp.]|uniref:DUF3556 domain-containing protein n=1 Tax=Sporichthya sp. TaxID=65475 RepID=UPI0017ECEE90|nr:DUF3556 domain-containing protein [Sporichthya sp.]MBA3741867.1 DUF3556 domain-containing protein [Sporichthya sp.]